jgi:hypothetical protein
MINGKRCLLGGTIVLFFLVVRLYQNPIVDRLDSDQRGLSYFMLSFIYFPYFSFRSASVFLCNYEYTCRGGRKGHFPSTLSP